LEFRIMTIESTFYKLPNPVIRCGYQVAPSHEEKGALDRTSLKEGEHP